ncbi:MAG: hypothetical protein Q4F10_03000 [Corynebacterium glutamicum]|nr:hypothetical protein [Corynebacterium glutamicum]
MLDRSQSVFCGVHSDGTAHRAAPGYSDGDCGDVHRRHRGAVYGPGAVLAFHGGVCAA